MTSRVTWLTAAATLVAAVLAVGWWLWPEDVAVTDHLPRDGAGPLVPGSGRGGYAMLPPGDTPWWGSIGAARMCLDGDASSARITGYRAITAEEAEPLEVRVMARHVTADDVDGAPFVDDFTMSAYGSVPDFAESYAQPPMYERGTFLPLDGLVITRRCDDLLHPGGGVKVPMHEVVVSVRSDDRGSVVEHLEIDYESGGRAYRVSTEFQMDFCGTAVEVEHCPGADE